MDKQMKTAVLLILLIIGWSDLYACQKQVNIIDNRLYEYLNNVSYMIEEKPDYYANMIRYIEHYNQVYRLNLNPHDILDEYLTK